MKLGSHITEQTRARMSEAKKGKPFAGIPYRATGENNPSKRPEVRKKISDALRGKSYHWQYGENNVAKRPEVRDKHRGMNNPMRNPEVVAKVSAQRRIKNQGAFHSNEAIKKMSEASKGKPHPWACGENNPMHRSDVKAKVSKALTGKLRPYMLRENHPNWNGGSSFEPYCPKFTREFKERVRVWFGYICPNCGTPQNREKLGVHHVHYNKDTCCDGSIPLFVPLCKPCHGKTNGKKNRVQSEQHFTELINTWYGGKCYFTREEMAAYGSPLPCEVPTV